MHVELKSVWQHMQQLGLGALAHANWHANYHSYENEHWPELSVLQAAHAAEILIKARIAQEHPLLIFDQVPRSSQSQSDQLDLQSLFERGRTIQFSDLPERLWAATSQRIPRLDLYTAFGQLRNCVQHFAVPKVDCSSRATEFIYGVIDPFINQHWGLFAIDYNEDTEPHEYLVQGLVERGVQFLVSPGSAECVKLEELVWANDAYEKEMTRRFLAARAEVGAETA